MMSVSAYGRRRGCSHEAVRRAIKSGRLDQSITVDAKGHPKINNPDLADQEWEAHTSEKRQRDWRANGAAVSRAKGGNGVVRPPPGSGDDDDGGGPPSKRAADSPLNKAKAARETYEARIAEFKYRKMKGELVDAAEIKREFATAARRVRDSLLAIPDRIASVVAAETDPDRVHRLMIEEIEQTLTALADHEPSDGGGDG